MRFSTLTLPLLCIGFLTTPAAAGVTTSYHHNSTNSSATISFGHGFTATITANQNNPPTSMIIDYLITTNDQAGWGNFQVRNSWDYELIFPYATTVLLETLQQQWLRVTVSEFPAIYDWVFPEVFEVCENVQVTRNNNCQGVSDDLDDIPGGEFTTPIGSVTAPDTVVSYVQHARDNPIGIGGFYGATQRLQAFLQHNYPGDCNYMSRMAAGAMRGGLVVPSALATGYVTTGEFTIPTGFGVGTTFSPTGDGHTTHCIIGGWTEGGVFLPFDTNNHFSGFTPLNFIMKGGLFEQLTDASYDIYVWGGPVTISSDLAWTNVGAVSSQTFSWSVTKTHTENWGGSNSHELFTQKTASSFKPGGPPPDVVGVPDINPEQRMLSVFCYGGHPAYRGGKVLVEIAAPENNTPVSLRLYDVLGRPVNTEHFGFEGRTMNGIAGFDYRLPDTMGVYFVKLTIGGQTATKKVVIAR